MPTIPLIYVCLSLSSVKFPTHIVVSYSWDYNRHLDLFIELRYSIDLSPFGIVPTPTCVKTNWLHGQPHNRVVLLVIPFCQNLQKESVFDIHSTPSRSLSVFGNPRSSSTKRLYLSRLEPQKSLTPPYLPSLSVFALLLLSLPPQLCLFLLPTDGGEKVHFERRRLHKREGLIFVKGPFRFSRT